jgi:O-antigen/teichoic acid export membrane protein
MTPPAPAPGGTTGSLSRDTRTALVNAIKLTMSLAATWSIGVLIRFWLPRHLGPADFGVLSFAEGLAATALGCAGLGIDVYISKEIPLRPAHASDFYGGAVVLRVVFSSLLIAGLLAMPLGGRHGDIRLVLLAFGIGYLLTALNSTLATLLQANSTVDELAVANVMAKVAWGGGMVAGILLGLPLAGLAAVLVLSEGLKLAYMQFVTRRRLALKVRVDRAATWAVVVASVGFYANIVALQIGWRLDVTLLGFLASNADVGWYGASQSLANISLLLAPILSAVLTPLFARAHSRSPEEMYGVLCRALEGIVALTLPVALVLSLGAELWVGIAFGRAYGPSAMSLRMLAPLFVFIYFNILLAAALVVRGRSWRLTWVSLTGIGVHAVAGLIFVPILASRFGPGGAGAGMALAGVTKELYVGASQLAALGRGIIDGPRRQMLLRSVVAAAGAVVTDALLVSLGPWRLLPALGVYAILAILLGALRPRALLALAGELWSARRRPQEGSH